MHLVTRSQWTHFEAKIDRVTSGEYSPNYIIDREITTDGQRKFCVYQYRPLKLCLPDGCEITTKGTYPNGAEFVAFQCQKETIWDEPFDGIKN